MSSVERLASFWRLYSTTAMGKGSRSVSIVERLSLSQRVLFSASLVSLPLPKISSLGTGAVVSKILVPLNPVQKISLVILPILNSSSSSSSTTLRILSRYVTKAPLGTVMRLDDGTMGRGGGKA